MRFEGSDQLADRRLGHMEQLCRARDTAGTHHGTKGLQLSDIHKVDL